MRIHLTQQRQEVIIEHRADVREWNCIRKAIVMSRPYSEYSAPSKLVGYGLLWKSGNEFALGRKTAR
jgi:hypothetical protein